MSCADVWLPWLSSFPSAALTVAACSLSSGRLCLRPLSCSFKPRLRQNHVIWHAQLLWGAVQLRYMLGGDRDRSLFAGMGKNPPTHIQNRAASCPSPPAPCNMVGPCNLPVSLLQLTNGRVTIRASSAAATVWQSRTTTSHRDIYGRLDQVAAMYTSLVPTCGDTNMDSPDECACACRRMVC